MVFIYKITSPSGKIYIGQTINIRSRIGHYKRLDCKRQTKLYRSLLKYGFNNHKIEVIGRYSHEYIDEMERYYIKLFNSVESGLNCEYGGRKNKTFSDLTRKKMSEAKTGKKMPYTSNDNHWTKVQKRSSPRKGVKLSEEDILKLSLSKSNNIIYVYDLHSKILLHTFNSAYECSIFLGVKHKSIPSNGRTSIVNNKFIIKRSNKEEPNITDYKEYSGSRVYCSKPVLKFDKQMNLLGKYDSAKEAGVENNINYKNILSVCNGRREYCGNFIWKFNDEKSGITVDHYFTSK